MTNLKNILALAAFATLATATAACGTEPDMTGYGAGPAPKLIYVRTSDGVVGSYQDNGVEVKFDLHRLRNTSSIVISTQDGSELLSSHTIDSLESVRAFDSIESSMNVRLDPTKIDHDVLDDLTATPEGQLLPALKAALEHDGIDIGAVLADAPAIKPVFCPTARNTEPKIKTDLNASAN